MINFEKWLLLRATAIFIVKGIYAIYQEDYNSKSPTRTEDSVVT